MIDQTSLGTLNVAQLPAAAATGSPMTRGEETFAHLLAGSTGSDEHRHSQASEVVSAKRQALREAAEQLVSTAFVTPVLGGLRENSTAAGPFAPSTAEKRFGPMLDQQFADRVVRAANFPLVDAIVDRYAPAPNATSSAMVERILA